MSGMFGNIYFRECQGKKNNSNENVKGETDLLCGKKYLFF